MQSRSTRTRRLRLEAKALQPVLSIGKNGITQGIIAQLADELERKQLVKIRFLRSFLEGRDKKEAAAELASFTKSQVVELVGHVLVLYRAG